MALVLTGLLTAGCATAITDTPPSLYPVPVVVTATDLGSDGLVECRLNHGFGVECHRTDADRTDVTGAVDDADGDRGVGPSHGTQRATTAPTDDAPATQAADVPLDDADAGSTAGLFLLVVGAAILVASSWIAPLVAAPRQPWDRPRS